jgi:hypothetical protein
MTENDDALHAARVILGGHRLSLSSQELFSRLEANPRVSRRELHDARRLFDLMQLGKAVEAAQGAIDVRSRELALLCLARQLAPYFIDRSPGWFRFLIAMGSQRSESPFRLDIVRRAHSTAAQTKDALSRSTHTRQAVQDMLIAGSILSRVEAGLAHSVEVSIQAAIEAAINDGDIATEEEAARRAFHRFRRYCRSLTKGGDTYRLLRYSGPIERFRERWVAVPEIGQGTSRAFSPRSDSTGIPLPARF